MNFIKAKQSELILSGENDRDLKTRSTNMDLSIKAQEEVEWKHKNGSISNNLFLPRQ